MAIQITLVNGSGSAIQILDTETNKRNYFQPTANVQVGALNGVPLGSVLIADERSCLFVKYEEVTVPGTFASAELLAIELLSNYFKSSSGGGASISGYNLEATQLLINTKLTAANTILANSYGSLLLSEGYLLELKKDFEAANNRTELGPLSVTTTSQTITTPANCKGSKIYNKTNGDVYLRIGAGALVRTGVGANLTLIIAAGEYYETQPFEREFPISYSAESALSGNLFVTQYYNS